MLLLPVAVKETPLGRHSRATDRPKAEDLQLSRSLRDSATGRRERKPNCTTDLLLSARGHQEAVCWFCPGNEIEERMTSSHRYSYHERQKKWLTDGSHLRCCVAGDS